jgi:hypothetical protein
MDKSFEQNNNYFQVVLTVAFIPHHKGGFAAVEYDGGGFLLPNPVNSIID